MNWLYELQGKRVPTLSEKEVDCVACKVHPPLRREHEYDPAKKCCEFSPFVSAFALGALLREGTDLEALFSASQDVLVPTVLGIIHSHDHRKTSNRLCGLFDSDRRNCKIWRHRPATCFTFFCVAEKNRQWEPLERQLLEVEAQLLQRWFLSQGGAVEDWATWGLVMEPRPLVDIPESMIFQDWAQAEAHYRQADQWLRDPGA